MRRASLLTVVALLVAGGGASSRAQDAAPGVRAELLEDGKAQPLTQFLVVGRAGTSRSAWTTSTSRPATWPTRRKPCGASWPTVHRAVDLTVE